MAKKKIVGADGAELKNKVPAVKTVRPYGSTVLIENLTPEEVMGTSLYVSDKTETGFAPQAYILALGPGISKDIGLKVGDRVVVQGKFIPVEVPGATRECGILELHNIKAILEEDK